MPPGADFYYAAPARLSTKLFMSLPRLSNLNKQKIRFGFTPHSPPEWCRPGRTAPFTSRLLRYCVKCFMVIMPSIFRSIQVILITKHLGCEKAGAHFGMRRPCSTGAAAQNQKFYKRFFVEREGGRCWRKKLYQATCWKTPKHDPTAPKIRPWG